MEEKNKDIKVIKKNNSKLFIIGALIVVIAATIIGLNAYAKFVVTRGGAASAQIAKMICEINVDATVDDENIINPYCWITVKNNYDVKENNVTTNHVTQTDVSYTIEVESSQALPKYYWQNDKNQVIATYDPEEDSAYTPLTGGMFTKNGDNVYEAESHRYKIVFVNPGDAVDTKDIRFNLIAIQPGN